MAPEDFEKILKFIVEQQAQFVVNQQKADERITRLETITIKLYEDMNARFDNVDAKISALVDAQIKTEESLRKTDENIRNLTAVVDRYFRERNGKS